MPGSFGTNKSPKPTFITSITEKNHPIVVEENTPPLPSSQHNKDNNVDADSGSDCSPLQCCQLYSSSSSSLSSQQNHASKDNDDNGNGCDGGNHHNGVDAGEVNARVTKRPRLAEKRAKALEKIATELARINKQKLPPIDLSGVPQLPPLPKSKGHVKEGASKYTGVSFCKQMKKWHARIKIDKKLRSIGYYENEEEAGIDFARALFKYNGKSAVVEKNETKYRRRRGKEMSDEHVMKVAAILAKQRSRLTGTNIDPNEFAKKMKESKGGFCFL